MPILFNMEKMLRECICDAATSENRPNLKQLHLHLCQMRFYLIAQIALCSPKSNSFFSVENSRATLVDLLRKFLIARNNKKIV